MTSMRERIARALYDYNPIQDQLVDADDRPAGKPFALSYEQAVEASPEVETIMLGQADAVLDVMREPTEEMIEAACQARCMIPNVKWDDGATEGVAAIERMLAEKMLTAAIESIQTSPTP